MAERLQRWTSGDFDFVLAPSEYGLVVVDWVTHTILDYQNYTSLDREYHLNLMCPAAMREFKGLVIDGRISEVALWHERFARPDNEEDYIKKPLHFFGESQADQFKNLFIAAQQGTGLAGDNTHTQRLYPSYCQLDLRPFNLVTSKSLDPSPEEWKELHDKLQNDMGFKLGPGDETEWSNKYRFAQETLT